MKTARIFKGALLLLTGAALLASCSKEDTGNKGPDTSAAGGDMTFQIGFAPQGAAQAVQGAKAGSPGTRAATDAAFNTTWEDGDQIGIFAVKYSGATPGTLAASGNYIHNVKLTYNKAAGTWTPETALWWPGSGKLDFYAYYPYDAAATNPTAIAFNVLSDQNATTAVSGAAKSNYNLSDLLTAKGNGFDKTSGAVSLQFSHALALVEVSVPLETAKGMGPSKNLTVKLRNVQAKSTLDLGAISATTGSEITLAATNNDALNITMHRVEQAADETSYTYRALVPAQAVAQGGSLFWFEHEGRQLIGSKALTARLDMAGGRAERYTIPLPQAIQTVLIPAGTFMMGSPADEPNRQSNETQHSVTLTKGFYMGKYEVTNAQYAAFLNARSIGSDGKGTVTYIDENGTAQTNQPQTFITSHSWGVKWNTDKWVAQTGYENHPVIYVTWYGAKAYADWVGGALPTEAQWEYACRAGTTTAFYFGNNASDLGAYGWSQENSNNSTKAVGQKTPNNYGLYDMHGNVREWCGDWFDNDYYSNSPAADPMGPLTGFIRVVRGGSWINVAQFCRSASRDYSFSGIAYDDIGFRVVFVD